MADSYLRPSTKSWPVPLPPGWNLAKLKTVASIAASNVDKKSEAGEERVALCNYTDVYYNDFIRPDLDFMEATASALEIRRFALQGGEVLLTKDSETAEDIARPAFVPAKLEGVVCGYHLYLLRPKADRLDGRYLFRACSVPAVHDQFVLGANGITRFGLGQEALGAALVPVPPLPTQRAIAAFLDRKTAEIDALIAKKERLIELLDEQRTALITQAVTRGLDPGVEMKDSGVEWLGEVPAHWQIAPLKWNLVSIEQGWSPQCENRQKEEDEWGVLKVGCVNGWKFDHTEHKALPVTEEPRLELEVGPGDLLMSRANTRDLVGKISFIRMCPPRLMMSDKLYRLSLKGSLTRGYLELFISSRVGRHEFERDASGASGSMQNISQGAVRGLLTLIPPAEEQVDISENAQRIQEETEKLVRKVKSAIDRLHEYRTALISAAVTGQIDVRDETP